MTSLAPRGFVVSWMEESREQRKRLFSKGFQNGKYEMGIRDVPEAQNMASDLRLSPTALGRLVALHAALP